jgi:hypothetical protein
VEVAEAAVESGSHWRRALRSARDAWIVAALLFLIAASFAAFFGWNSRQVDAKAYWDGGTRLRTGVALYATEPVPALAKAYLYPPAFAAFIAPLTALPPLWGYAVWMALQIAFAVALARVSAALAGIGVGDTDGRRTALALALAAGLAPLSESLGEGQANLVIALLCALAVLEVERGHDRRAAFALAAAVHVKLVPIVLAGAFLAWGRRRAVWWLGLALVVVGCVSLPWRVAALGPGAGVTTFATDYADFWHAILRPAAGEDRLAGVEQLFAPNYALRGTLSRLFVEDTALSAFPSRADRRGPLVAAMPRAAVNGASTLTGLGMIAVALWWCRRSAADGSVRPLGAGLLLLAALLAGPSFWQHGLVLLSIAGAGLWRALASRRPSERALVWTWVGAPFFLVLTVPFLLHTVGVGSEKYRDIREWGVPTLAAINLFVAGLLLARPRSSA